MVYIPMELLVEILLRLPWTSLRRFRLVCRSWRDLIHERTTEMQQRRVTVPLIVTTESVYVLDDQEAPSTRRELWPAGTTGSGLYRHMEVVGACNGVLCLCDDTKPGGTITLVNPATGDALALPPNSCPVKRHNSRRPGRSWHQAYSFGYHHATGQYKVMHVPCFFKTKETLQVFTVGDASWRDVPATGARCRLDAGIVSVNGATYWVTEGNEMIMCFDHRRELVRSTKPLPTSARRPICQITQVHRRLGAATSEHIEGDASIEVWILESTGKETWTHQYSIRFHPVLYPSVQRQPLRVNFFYSESRLSFGALGGQDQKLFSVRHKSTNDATPSEECRVVYSHYWFEKPHVSDIRGDICRTFMYMKTAEALSVYRRW